MTLPSIKKALLLAHRWVALALAPLFVLILPSGAVLALKPIVDDLSTKADGTAVSTVHPVDTASLVALLDRVDPQETARLVSVDENGRTVSLQTMDRGAPAAFDVVTGDPVETPKGFDLFGFAKRLHKDLLIGAEVVVEIAAYAMVLIRTVQFSLRWPV